MRDGAGPRQLRKRSTVDVLWTPLPPTGGTCSAGAPTADATKVTFASHGRVCTADADAGAPVVATPFAACIMSFGVASCPAGPLSVAHAVGTGATIACASSCSCSVEATCSGAQVTYYTAASCTGGKSLAMQANGVCTSASGGGTTYGYYRYTATLAGPTCRATGTSAASVTGLAGEQTICCAN